MLEVGCGLSPHMTRIDDDMKVEMISVVVYNLPSPPPTPKWSSDYACRLARGILSALAGDVKVASVPSIRALCQILEIIVPYQMFHKVTLINKRFQ